MNVQVIKKENVRNLATITEESVDLSRMSDSENKPNHLVLES